MYAVVASLPACNVSMREVADTPAGGESSPPGDASTVNGTVSPQAGGPASPAQGVARLTREQYLRSVQDLLGADSLPNLDLPVDEHAGPFVATGQVDVGSLAVGQYLAAAERVVGLNRASLIKKLPCTAAAMDADCINKFVVSFGARVQRRPLSDEQVQRYAGLAEEFVAAGDADSAVSQIATAMFISPGFLYRLELGDPDRFPELSQFEVATRLAYFLTGSTPDDALAQAAADGALATPEQVTAQVGRLVGTGAFTHQMQRFVSQLLGLDGVSQVTKDTSAFPNFTPALLAAIAQESNDFVASVVKEKGGQLETLLTAPYSLVTQPLAALYNLTLASTAAPTRVSLDPTQRAGMLTQAAFLAVHAHPTASAAAVPRGKVLRENLLCQILPPPPPQTPPLPPVSSPNATARQMFANHESVQLCAGCHKLIDPLGLAFEHFDSVGKWRDKQGTSDIDTSGTIGGTANTSGSFAGATSLAGLLADSPDVHACVVRQAWRFAMARSDIAEPADMLAGFGQAFNAGDHRLTDLMATIAASSAMGNLAPVSAP